MSAHAKVTRWWWVRHAPVTANQQKIYGGDDLPCDCSDHEAFKYLAATLPETALLVTSGLKRTKQTADAIIAKGFAPHKTIEHKAFNEQSFGKWQGQYYNDVLKSDPLARHDYWLCPGYLRPPEGESFLDLMARVSPAIEEISARHQGGDIVCTSHGGTIRAALGYALGLSAEHALAFRIDNLSVTRIDRVEKEGRLIWHVAMVNRPSGLVHPHEHKLLSDHK